MGEFSQRIFIAEGRNPFLSRAGFDENSGTLDNEDKRRGRNPFLSRAGFDDFAKGWLEGAYRGRNPFLSRAGFDNFTR